MTALAVLDAFCCAGGATRGYQLAGFDEVDGIDIDPQPNYVGNHFLQMDGIIGIREYGPSFDLIHMSPPCQFSTALTKGTNKHLGTSKPRAKINLIGPAREAAISTGRPWVLENVQGSEVRRDVTLCGTYFGLKVFRHRYFELGGGAEDMVPDVVHEKHAGRVTGWRHGVKYAGEYFAVYGDGGGKGSVQDWQRAMGMDWTDVKHELSEAIPPAYTEYIGRHILKGLTS